VSTIPKPVQGPPVIAVTPERKRRRPSGEPPPLPRPLRSTGALLIALAVIIIIGYVILITVTNAGHSVIRFDASILRWVTRLRTPGLTRGALWINDWVASDDTNRILRWGTIVLLLGFRRFRHLLVYIGAVLGVGSVTSVIAMILARPRPMGISILDHWQGASHPSRPLATLSVTLLGILYTLLVPGRARNVGKLVAGAVLLIVAAARLYLGVDHPTDVLAGLILGVTISILAFRLFTPNDVFPVTYKGGRTAHLDIGGERGVAIRTALQEQLGLSVVDMKPVGLEGSGGSTPLRVTIAGGDGQVNFDLFAKLYAQNHLKADRSYKLGRTLLYGRLEDESSFSTVRRLVQYEDYLLRFMRDAGVNVPRPYGFVEITPEREYLLVTDFLGNAQEIREAEVSDELLDNALRLIRRLWDAGIAHRDIKPSNLMVRGNELFVIDVAFGEIRPSPWREAVDLANMMIVLALRCDAERVYGRALRFFTPDEIAEAFAATRGITMPSQSRAMLKKGKRDIVRSFRELAPARRPISIQRWSARRVGLMVTCLVAAFIIVLMTQSNLAGAGLVTPPRASAAGLSAVVRPPECRNLLDDAVLLVSQSVPSASLIPCVQSMPIGWRLRTMDVDDDSTRFYFDYDRPGAHDVTATFTRDCDLSGATQVPSDKPPAARFELVRGLENEYSGSRFYTFDGGCLHFAFEFTGPIRTALADEIASALGFKPRSEITAELARAGLSS
jgi:membrane-associated phospholipid phosphatase/serine/threonine-protein kinase RIO1